MRVGIGRRHFLKLFGATIAAAATDPLQATVVDEDLYINRALGVAFAKPRDWHYVSLQQFAKLKSEQILKDENLRDELKGLQDPLAVMSMIDPKESQEVGPSIAVYVEPFEYEEGETLSLSLPDVERLYQKYLKRYRSIGEALEKSVSGCESVEFFAEFLYERPVTQVMARNRCLISVREPQLFTFNMFDYPELQRDAQPEYDAFAQSIVYV
ncbi:MAG: hypothetical protein AAF657_24085 [Acidobacteriota bacterium]